MRGSIKKSESSWYYVVDLGRDPATGKRRQERKRGFRTKRDAQEALDERLAEVRTGAVVVDRSLTVAAYLNQWLDAKRMAGVRPTTLHSYRRHIDLYFVPHFGNVRLRDLRGAHIEAMLAEIAKPPVKPAKDAKLSKGQRRNPRQLGPASIQRIHATLRSALGTAKKQRLISFNPAVDVELPRVPRPKVNPWEPEELGQFLAHAQNDRLGAVFETIAMTGLRRGEALGLRWPDVNFERKVLVVRQQLVEVDGTGVPCPYCGEEHRQVQFGAPKTSSGEAPCHRPRSGHPRRVDGSPTEPGGRAGPVG
ncbi:site-specific integrase [Gordonia amicalis]|nr:site-specific integrase [Gordonia amicalis]